MRAAPCARLKSASQLDSVGAGGSNTTFTETLTNVGATAQKVNLGAYPAAPATSYAGLAQTARSHDPSNETLQQGTYSVTFSLPS